MQKIVIIDHSLRNLDGHHYEYDVSVAEAAERLGYEPIIVSHKAFPKHLHPVNIRVIPAFTRAWIGDEPLRKGLLGWLVKYVFKLSGLTGLGQSLKRTIRSALKIVYLYLLVTAPQLQNFWYKVEAAISRLPRALKSDLIKLITPLSITIALLRRVLPISTFGWLVKGFIGLLKESYTLIKAKAREALLWFLGSQQPVFANRLRDVLRTIGVTSEDHVFIHTLGIEQLEQVLDLLNRCDRKKSPHYHILLRRDCNEPIVTLAKGIGLRACLNRFYGSGLWAEVVTFYTDTDELTEQHNAQSPIRFITAPIPFRHEKLKERSKPRTALDPIHIVYLGDARPEKGYQHLPELLDALWMSHVRPGKVKFTIQSNYNLPGGEPGIREARLRLEQYPSDKVRLLKEPLPPDVYYELLAEADIVVIPYQPDCYAVRSSGVLVESLAAGKPVVVPADTWMAKQVDESRASIYHSPGEIPDAVNRLLRNLDQFAEAAAQYQIIWRAKHSPDGLVKCLMEKQAFLKSFVEEAVPSILYIVDADSIEQNVGAGQVVRSHLQYLSRCGYRVYGVFFFQDPRLSDQDFTTRASVAKNVIKNFNLIESWFLRYKFHSILNLKNTINYINQFAEAKNSLERDLIATANLEIPLSLRHFLKNQPIDAILLNYICRWSLIEKLGLKELPIICEMHDIQSHQYALANYREIDEREFKKECSLLDNCTVVLANNLKELEKVQEIVRNPSFHHVPYIGRLSPPKISDLAVCTDLVEVLRASGSERREDHEQNHRLKQEHSIDLLYVSSYNVPNSYSLKWFFHKVYLPYLADKGVTFVIAGNIMSFDELKEINHPKVFIAGQVENLRPLYAATRLVILPIQMGAGFNIKTVEALSMGKPVVATSMALRGIDFDREVFPVFNEPEAYAKKIIELLESPQARLEQAKRGFDIVQSQYNQVRYDDAMNAAFADFLGEKALTPTLVDTPAWEPCLVEWSSESPENEHLHDVEEQSERRKIAILYPWSGILERKTGASKRAGLLIDYLKEQSNQIWVCSPDSLPDSQEGNVRYSYFSQTSSGAPLVREVYRSYHRLIDIMTDKVKPDKWELSQDTHEDWLIWQYYQFRFDPSFNSWIEEITDWADVVLLEYPFWASTVGEVCRRKNLQLIISNYDVMYKQLTGDSVVRQIALAEEIRSLKQADQVICMSIADQEFFREYGVEAKVVPIPIDIQECRCLMPEKLAHEYIKQLVGFNLAPKNYCLFIGSNHQPNIEAVQNIRQIAKDLYEDSLESYCYFVIVGECCEPEQTDNVLALGKVDSEVLQALYQMAALIVSPLVSGTGTSVKIIEALAHGKPIIGTQVAFRGYPVESGVHCIVNDDLAEYPRLITELLPNLEKRQKLGNEARKFAEAYDYRKIYQQYAELIEVHHRNESVTSAT